MPTSIPRRRFLAAVGGAAGCAAGAAGLLVLPSPRAARGYPAHEVLNLAVVGMAGYGAYHGFAEAIHTYDRVRYAVSCDVDLRKVRRVYDLWEERAREWSRSDDEARRRAAAEHYVPLTEKKPPLYRDYRRMLDEARDEIDAVVVATPDHTHAVISAAALRAGKPVLAEKPLTISAHEARALGRLAGERKLPTQVNTGGAASPGFRRGVEIVREGLIGPVREVHVFFSRGGRNFDRPPAGGHPVPPELEWNLWLAQVAWREYDPGWINRIAWRDTSLGELGNFGPHSGNLAFLSLRAKDLWDGAAEPRPIRIEARCSEVNRLSYPRWETIRWEIPERGELPPFALTWHHGHPPEYAPGSRAMLADLLREHGASDAEMDEFLPYAGCILKGDRGLLATDSHNTKVRLLPARRFEGVETARPLSLPTSPGHYREWVEACRKWVQARGERVPTGGEATRAGGGQGRAGGGQGRAGGESTRAGGEPDRTAGEPARTNRDSARMGPESAETGRSASTPASSISSFEHAAPFAELLAVGNIATRFPGETLEFDPATGRIANHAAAAELLEYPYREGWTL